MYHESQITSFGAKNPSTFCAICDVENPEFRHGSSRCPGKSVKSEKFWQQSQLRDLDQDQTSDTDFLQFSVKRTGFWIFHPRIVLSSLTRDCERFVDLSAAGT